MQREPAEASDLDDPNYQHWCQRQREAAEARRLIPRPTRRTIVYATITPSADRIGPFV